ncbi:ead/Ea22-like family protein [Salmonella enterica subsp. enterica]|uniref:ead/Ea22-like family protein n=1 Tax=Salmonella enterica TaxID=28901 RepID=UPI0003BCAEAE|nr:ead/Ea22-like family protein [Salmonella enterica]EBY6161311.1 ead/Ea22-like family protein [Salmonella enterica subsp. enterica serovar Nchanga]ECE0259106.1 ead/Ea22-like family protein [Salmonella enterica subsp. enterica]ECX1197517.1 ead/Ea22-like family protein [Salmonella enterica subsp. enterica serovar Bareilly]EDT2892472.1 ead/Ea22-like family protein [Salmonella enterica subsp. enterica serovar Litchfield]EAU9638435.1 ead/Ea22-like family protein [Salmonella enterica]
MSNIDKQALREVAEKATKGPWTLFSDIDTKTFSIHTPRDKRCENVIKWGGFDCQPNAEANAEFIAAFNPKVALALLDELDSANGYASAYEAEKWHYHGLAESEGERADRAEKQVEELTMWIKRLAYSLRNTRPDSKLHIDAMDYLSSKGLISVEDVLR